jgi:hypothetical protein
MMRMCLQLVVCSIGSCLQAVMVEGGHRPSLQPPDFLETMPGQLLTTHVKKPDYTFFHLRNPQEVYVCLAVAAHC